MVKSSKWFRVFLILTALELAALTFFAMSALADEPENNTEHGVDLRIGEEVNRICFPRNINGWKAVKGEDNVLLLEEGVNDWYRVELIGACDYRVLRRAMAIAIDSRPRGGCITRGDRIIVEDSPGFNRRCAISQINVWDDDAPAPGEEDEETSETN